MTKDRIDATWDRADAETNLAWAEMEDFLKAMKERGPASTPEQRKRDQEQFIEIHERYSARCRAIFERAVAGYPPTN